MKEKIRSLYLWKSFGKNLPLENIFNSINPATGKKIATVAEGNGKRCVDKAVGKAARKGIR